MHDYIFIIHAAISKVFIFIIDASKIIIHNEEISGKANFIPGRVCANILYEQTLDSFNVYINIY